MNITICGGGNLGHVCAAFLSAQVGNRVSLLTSRPEQWSEHIEVRDCNGLVYHGVFHAISNQPRDVVPDADLILLCLPGFAIRGVLRSIAPCLKPSAWVGTVVSSTGFFFEAIEALPASQPLFGFQRVPFISRVTRYGREAELKGYKDSLGVAIEHADDKESVRAALEQLFKVPVRLLANHYEVSLSNSNPLLHTSRLYMLWKDWEPGASYDRNPGFYSEWTVPTSELYIAMDEELQSLLRRGAALLRQLGCRVADAQNLLHPRLPGHPLADDSERRRQVSSRLHQPLFHRGLPLRFKAHSLTVPEPWHPLPQYREGAQLGNEPGEGLIIVYFPSIRHEPPSSWSVISTRRGPTGPRLLFLPKHCERVKPNSTGKNVQAGSNCNDRYKTDGNRI